jgi:zinc protease
MANYIIGGMGLNSLLADRLRQKEGLSYGAGSRLEVDSQDDYGRFVIFAICNPKAMEKLDASAADVLAKVLKNGVTEDELKLGVKGYLAEMKNDRAKDDNLMAMLGDALYLDRTMEYYTDLEQKTARLTVADVNAALRRHIDPRRLVIAKAGDFAKAKGGAPK